MTDPRNTAGFDRLQRRFLLGGGVALVLSVVGAVFSPSQFFHAYLVGYLFWIGIALGCLALLMLHHLVGGRWGFVIQRLLESGARTLPLMALLFLPLFAGGQELYVWARPEAVAADPLLTHKELYLNPEFFFIRTVGYFAVWIGLGSVLTMLSIRQDAGLDVGRLTRRIQVLSGPGLVLYGLTVTFAAVDWVMSIEPHWYSTIYGAVFMIGQALAALAFAIVVLVLLSRREPLDAVVSPARLHDLGNLLLAFVMVWAYFAFSQHLIIWSGNLPEEITFYVNRMAGVWNWMAIFLIAFHFLVPFLLLLQREVKRRARVLLGVALGLLVMRLVDLTWIVAPAFHPTRLALHWMDLVVPVGLGGIWLATFLWHLKRRPLLPQNDPRFAAGAEPAHGA